MLDVKEAVNENTTAIVDAIRMNAGSTSSDGDKEADQDDREDAAREQQDEKAAAGKEGSTDPEKNPEQGKFSKFMTKSFKSIGKLFKKVFTGFNLFILAIGAVVLALLNSGGVGIMEKMKDVFNTFVTKVIPPILEMVADIGAVVTPFLLQLLESFGMIAAMIAPVITRLVQIVLPPVMAVLNSLIEAFMCIFNVVAPIVTRILNDVLPPLGFALAQVFELIGNILEVALPPLLTVFETVGKVLGLVAGVFGTVVGLFNDIFDLITSMTDGAGNFLLMANLWNGILSALQGLLSFIPFTDGISDSLENAKIDTSGMEERIETRKKDKVGRDADAAIEKGIDMDAPYMEVQTSVNKAVADGTMSKEVGQAILAKKEEKDLLENPENINPDPNKDAMLTMSDLFGPSEDADREFVMNKNMLPADLQGAPEQNINQTAANVNNASQDASESEKDTKEPIINQPGSDQFASFVNQQTSIRNITTGVIGTGGDSSLGHRHRRVLPGVA